ncbi:MAG: hypothetical protein KIT24_12280 [Phycisphaeraceae bacterium]|nr:hypothetical protein [Phycisphaeraceae bacterium]
MRATLGGGVLLAAVCLVVFSAIGRDAPFAASFGSVLLTLATAGGWAGLYLLSAAGWGTLGDRLWAGARAIWLLRLGFGLAVQLSLAHAVFALGLLSSWPAISILAVGWGLLCRALLSAGRAQFILPSLAWWLCAPPVCLLIVAACNPPGVLWSSEFGGYDALSYHLQLPQEWLAAGRVHPVEHNVYSYLPGYLEAAFAHLAAASFADPTAGLLADSGWRVSACHFLHAWCTVLAGWGVRCAVLSACASDRRASPAEECAGWLACALVLATPWMIVVGSLAYNDATVVFFASVTIVACIEPRLGPVRRSVISAVLVGAACGVKPTAMLFVAPVAACLLFGQRRMHARDAWRMLVVGAAVGSAMLAPWLVRNAAYGGNPVFPYFSGIFGSAHWTHEQVARYASAHFAHEGLLGRLALLAAPIGDQGRGFAHTQWGLFAPAVLVASIASIRTGPRIGRVLVAAMAVQLVAWLTATHLQSRFLLPIAATGGVLCGLAAATAIARGGSNRAKKIVCTVFAATVLVQMALAGWNFARQNDGMPNEHLVTGTQGLSGTLFRDSLRRLPEDERARVLAQSSDWRFVNLGLASGETVLLIGDATPFYLRRPVIYATTWDTSMLGRLMREQPDDPRAWTRAMRDRGVRYVLISFPELARLAASEWNDPLLTPARVAAWAHQAGATVWRWPHGVEVPMKIIVRLE